MTIPTQKNIDYAALQGAATDRYNRRKRKLRLSVTDRCNYRCPYCMPEHPDWADKDTLLSDAEMQRLISIAVERLGITELRLTGGEPLLKKNLESFVQNLQPLKAKGLRRISLTSNGQLLAKRAADLRAAGIDDINISLDALDDAVFAAMSGNRGSVDAVKRGILACVEAGLPVKLNAVIIRDHNEGQIVELTRWAMARNLPLRFIEFMPLDGDHRWARERVVGEQEILNKLSAHYRVVAMPDSASAPSPARYYRLINEQAHHPQSEYKLGIISTVTRPFCSDCDRLRLTATGALYPCLFSDKGAELRELIRRGDDADIESAIREAVWHKDAGYAEHPGYVERPISMHSLGG